MCEVSSPEATKRELSLDIHSSNITTELKKQRMSPEI